MERFMRDINKKILFSLWAVVIAFLVFILATRKVTYAKDAGLENPHPDTIVSYDYYDENTEIHYFVDGEIHVSRVDAAEDGLD